MKQLLHTFLAAWLGSAATSAWAADQTGAFGTIGATLETIQPEADFESFTATSLTARLGYDFGRYFGIEAEGAIGLSGSGTEGFGFEGRPIQDETYDYKGGYAVFLKPSLPVSDTVKVHGRLGLGGQFFDRTVNDFDLADDDSARRIEDRNDGVGYFGAGLGAEIAVGPSGRDGVRLDYLGTLRATLIEDEGSEGYWDSSFSVAYVRRF